MENNWSYARLSKEELTQINTLEEKLGKTLVAFEHHAAFAELSETELTKIRDIEKEHGIVLLAYQIQ